MIIKRDKYLNRLISLMNNGRAKIITGIRRSGKSFLLKNIFIEYLKSINISESQIIYIQLDDINNNELLNPLSLYSYIKTKIVNKNLQYYVIIDEIQRVYSIINPIMVNNEIKKASINDTNILGFTDVVLGLLHIDNVDVYITGSNSKFLSKDILTEFRDRGDEIRVQPLTFKEFYSFFENTSLDQIYDEYMTYGGMPLILTFLNFAEKQSYLKNLFEITYNTDIVERNNIRNIENLRILSKILASSIGNFTNSSIISNTFKTTEKIDFSKITIGNYLEYFEDSFIVEKVERYDIKGRRHIGASYKYYFSDIGLRNSRLNFLHIDDGALMENIIYNELKFRGYDVEIGIVNVYGKENNETIRKTYETDFIARKGNQVIYIQSCYKLSSNEKIQSELNSFLNIKDSFKKILIVKNLGINRRDENGIIYLDLYDFLLNEDLLERA